MSSILVAVILMVVVFSVLACLFLLVNLMTAVLKNAGKKKQQQNS